MRLIGGLLLTLAGLGYLASELSFGNDSPPPEPTTQWRRTVDGWEKPVWLTSDLPIRRPALHPTIVGLLQVFLALVALLLFEKRGQDPIWQDGQLTGWPRSGRTTICQGPSELRQGG